MKKTRKLLIATVILLLVLGLVFSIKTLLATQKELAAIRNSTPVVIQITNTPIPTLISPTPEFARKAWVEEIHGMGRYSFLSELGQAGALIPGAYLETGTIITSADGSIRILVEEEEQGVPGTMILFPLSYARIVLREKLTIELIDGMVFVNPGVGGSIVNIQGFADVAARLLESGGRMAVKLENKAEVTVMCFTGPCEFGVPDGTDKSWITIKDGEKRIFNLLSRILTPGLLMDYEEMLRVNRDCNSCMFDLIFTPTTRPVEMYMTPVPVTNEDDVKKESTVAPNSTRTPYPTEEPTEVPTEEPAETTTEEITQESNETPPPEETTPP